MAKGIKGSSDGVKLVKEKILGYLEAKLRTDCDGGQARVLEIAARLGYHPQYISKFFRQLKQEGFITQVSRYEWKLAENKKA